MYLSAKEVKDTYKISNQTLYNWRKKGKIKFKQLPSGKFLYFPIEENRLESRKNVIYARVSNTKQKKDLETQIKVLQEHIVKNGFICDGIYYDIGSGMNESRKDFNRLLDDVIDGKIETVWISYKDRLIRFGFDTISSIFKKFGTRIEVLNSTREEDFQTELTEDLISIIHHFSMKMYSNRRKILKNCAKSLNSEK